MKHNFNLIEVAMALGIIGFGVASVMSIFPAALLNANNSMSENYAPNAASQFFSYLSSEAKKEPDWLGGSGDSKTYKENWDLVFDNLSSTKPAQVNGSTIADTKSAEGTPVAIPNNNNIEASTVAGVYYVTQGDFVGVARVWTSKIADYFVGDPDGNSEQMIGGMKFQKQGESAGKVDVVADAMWNSDFSKYATCVYVELSWPSHKPYSRREKRVYFMEFFNPWSMNQ